MTLGSNDSTWSYYRRSLVHLTLGSNDSTWSYYRTSLVRLTLGSNDSPLAQFERAMAMVGFDHLPADLPPIMDYLGRFNGESGRHRRNQQDILGMVYRYAHRQFGLPNPMAGLPRPRVTTKPPRVLSLDQVRTLDEAPQTLRERCALDMLMGHGWRQVEVRRIRAGDVRDVQNGMIWVRGKERDE